MTLKRKGLSSAGKFCIAVLAAILIFGISSPSHATDSPHGNDVVCDYCHSTIGTNGGVIPSPFWGGAYTPPDGDLELTTMNLLCTGCHVEPTGGSFAPNRAIQVRTHTSMATQEPHTWTPGVDWAVECVACHNPHYQRQYVYYRNLAPIKLAQGTVNTITSNGMVNGIPQSTIGYTLNVAGSKVAWRDPDTWYNKSSMDRGAIIYPNSANLTYTYNILYADATTITVRGDVTAGITAGALGAGKTFMITYGGGKREGIRTRKDRPKYLQGAYNRDSNTA